MPVTKKSGKMRLCVDLRPLNQRVVKQKYPFPVIEDCLSRLANKSVFTLLDLKDGFHQIKVHNDSTKYFAFATPNRQFEYTRLSFGYCESPAEFQKRIMNLLDRLIREEKVIVYMDDILIASRSVDSNLDILKEVLTTLYFHGFELNLKKCLFLCDEIEFLGYQISSHGVTISDRHTEAIQNFKSPRNVKELQRFLGLAGYFRKFINQFAIKSKPLTELLKKNAPYEFSEECVKAFTQLLEELTSKLVLRLYDPAAPTELHTDVCSLGIGAILLQKQSGGVWAPIAYFSQSTNRAERNYHSFELEMLAIVRAVERFRLYLYGLEFAIITDCNALVYAVTKANLNPRIARWILQLQNYRFKLMHRPGKKMAHVDALSRSVAYVRELPIERN